MSPQSIITFDTITKQLGSTNASQFMLDSSILDEN